MISQKNFLNKKQNRTIALKRSDHHHLQGVFIFKNMETFYTSKRRIYIYK